MNMRLDHVAIAVASLSDALPLLERLSGMKGSPRTRVESQGVDVCFVGNVELVEPVDRDTGVARFVDKRGTCLHHLAYAVDDVGRAMTELAGEGYRFTSTEPIQGSEGHPVAFLHPQATGGLLIELVEKAESPAAAAREDTAARGLERGVSSSSGG